MIGEDDIISRYTRAEAIEDGTLIDLTKEAAVIGYKIPVAVTATLYHRYLNPDEEAMDLGQTLQGRIHDLLTDLIHEIRKDGTRCRVRITESFLMNEKTIDKPQIDCAIDGGDDGNPVITIMFPGED